MSDDLIIIKTESGEYMLAFPRKFETIDEANDFGVSLMEQVRKSES